MQTLLKTHGFDVTIEQNNLLPTLNNLNLYAVRN